MRPDLPAGSDLSEPLEWKGKMEEESHPAYEGLGAVWLIN